MFRVRKQAFKVFGYFALYPPLVNQLPLALHTEGLQD